MKSNWGLTCLDARVPDELLCELCENFSTAMWSHYMSGASIIGLTVCFKSRCRNLALHSPSQLAFIRLKLDYWFQDLSQEEQEYFSDAFELLDLALEEALNKR